MSRPPFRLSDRHPAVVTVDVHRGHLDPSVATMPVPADRAEQVVRANAFLADHVRAAGVPVIHVMTSYRSAAEIAKNPWWVSVAGTTATRRNVLTHQVAPSPGVEIMPEILRPGDIVVATKKRYDCFVATDLEHVLRSLDIDTLILTGINTNSCVLATAIAGNVRDYAVVVVRECVDTMDRSLHEPALDIIDSAFGWTMTTAEVLDSLGVPATGVPAAPEASVSP
jgi:Amidases related to nicotinamidase